ncbi:indeterminate(ID)-domain 4, IMPERIAL EAGLE [Hibiscus trionum]|uniref:Indeterminate(ID)-domain 4, IMPERIAL EAGLE n=1 Tax=Hibiscus trionum TaxID=183268 RepID=A0A9W7IXR7_HIBTR|nr:indeterminate(ID)-domain 4, IMPERIAL EAGLE [Hibiscus trionum]
MEASSSLGVFFGIREDSQNPQQQQQQQQHSTTPTSAMGPAPPQQPPQKKRRNQPGTPNPDAEVIALSPKSLMATNRFICEVCNKGFQREQNLQLHRRGHNLPWKLRQKTTKEVKKKVYLCPEPTCVHHDPSRPLGDLTGIKKHYSRKHGEKKWKCDKCSKWYAVQSDWKAHSKICGTREYKCDCGTLFSRRDSFITHRAFCDALTQENARRALDSIGHRLNGSSTAMSLGLSRVGTHVSSLQDQNNTGGAAASGTQFDHFLLPSMGSVSSASFFLHEANQEHQPHQISSAPSFINLTSPGLLATEHFSSNIMGSDQININIPSLFAQNNNMVPQMSATALLQKAAQMGSTSSNNNNSSSASLAYSFGHEQGEHQHQPQQQQSLNVSGGGSDGLTRDFLGVGQIVRIQREQQHQHQHQQQQGMGLSALGCERTNITAPAGHHSFEGDGNFQ